MKVELFAFNLLPRGCIPTLGQQERDERCQRNTPSSVILLIPNTVHSGILCTVEYSLIRERAGTH